MSDDDDIAADFLVEAQEIADRLGEELVALEQVPDDAELLNAVFRGFHTIKGGASFLNLHPLVDVCHAVEEAFGLLRQHRQRPSAELFDGAQVALDHANGMLAALASGAPMAAAPAALLARLLGAGSASVVAATPVAPAPAASAPASHDAPISDDEFEALLNQFQTGAAAPPSAPAPAPSLAPVAPPAAEVAEPIESIPLPPRAAADKAPAETSVRVDTRRLDAIVNLAGELVLARNRIKTLRVRARTDEVRATGRDNELSARSREDEMDRAISALDIATSRLQSAVMKTRMQPVGRVLGRFPKVARDVARTLGKEVALEIIGADTELDRNLVEALADPLVHLLRNAIDHGIEAPDVRARAGKPRTGNVRLSALQEGDHINIEVRDDGAGIDPEVLRSKAIGKGLIGAEAAARLSADECLHLVFLPGFSTKAQATEISGRGVGMDVVQSRINELNGRVNISSEPGQGSAFLIRVPLTLAILPVLLVHADRRPYALPLARVREVLDFRADTVRWIDGRQVLELRNGVLPLLYLTRWLDLGDDASDAAAELGAHDADAADDDRCVVVLQASDSQIAVVVDRIRGREEAVIKPLPAGLKTIPGYSGATLTGDGKLALILDVETLANDAHANIDSAANRVPVGNMLLSAPVASLPVTSVEH